MSQAMLAKMVVRASTDAAFRAQLQRNLDNVLAGYDLNAEERAAIKSGDAGRLQSLGMGARISTPWDTGGVGDGGQGPFGPTMGG